jgi:mRNA interferase YafQ
LARELVILPRFKRDYRLIKRHPEFDKETIEHVFDLLIDGAPLPEALKEHVLHKRAANWAGYMECHLGADLLMIYRVTPKQIVMHRIGTHIELFTKHK